MATQVAQIPFHGQTVKTVDEEFLALKEQGNFQDAVRLARERLAQSEKEYGPNHLQTANWLNQLGQRHSLLGDYDQAEALYKRALEVFGRSFGAEHPTAAQAMSNLAGLHTTLGNYQRSEQLQRQALDILEKTYGTYHLREEMVRRIILTRVTNNIEN